MWLYLEDWDKEGVEVKIAWIQDLDPLVEMGGAQMNDRAMILAGLRRGHEVQVVLPSRNPGDVAGADLAVVSRCVGMGVPGYDELTANGIPYVFFHHDYAPGLCRWSLFYPMLDRCKTVCFLRERWEPTLKRAKKHIWLSPLHRWAWLWAYPSLKGMPHAVVPSAVDPRRFPERTEAPEPNTAIAVESGAAFKGWKNVKAWAEAHPEITLTLVGSAPDGDMPANVKHVGFVPNTELAGLYRKHERFVHLASSPMPFERVAAEARLSGCRMVLNRNVGALSYPWFRKDRDDVVANLLAAPGRFWTAVEGSL